MLIQDIAKPSSDPLSLLDCGTRNSTNNLNYCRYVSWDVIYEIDRPYSTCGPRCFCELTLVYFTQQSLLSIQKFAFKTEEICVTFIYIYVIQYHFFIINNHTECEIDVLCVWAMLDRYE